MKRTCLYLILMMVIALFIGMTIHAQVPADAPLNQTPLTSLTAGCLFENGSTSHFLVKGDVRQNLKSWTRDDKNVIIQTYARAGFVRGNDVSLNPNESQKLQGIDLLLITEYHFGDFFFGGGYGRAWELEDTVTIEVPVYAGVLGWQPMEELRIHAGIDYYKRANVFSNVVGVHAGIAFDLKELIE